MQTFLENGIKNSKLFETSINTKTYSAAWKFVNPLELYIFLHKYDPKHHQIFAQVLKVDKENWIKQMRQKCFLCHLFIEKNDPVLHICVLQKYVNLLD